MLKKCPLCRQEKDLQKNYYSYKDGHPYPYCKECWIKYSNNRRITLDGRFSELKKDAKRNGKEFFLIKEDLKDVWNKPCLYCGREINLVSLDRKNNLLPYTKENIAVCCRWCNYTKGTGSLSFFYNQCKKVYDNMPENFKTMGNVDDCGKRFKNTFK